MDALAIYAIHPCILQIPLYTPVYPCIRLFTLVYPCLPLYTTVYPCIPLLALEYTRREQGAQES